MQRIIQFTQCSTPLAAMPLRVIWLIPCWRMSINRTFGQLNPCRYSSWKQGHFHQPEYHGISESTTTTVGPWAVFLTRSLFETLRQICLIHSTHIIWLAALFGTDNHAERRHLSPPIRHHIDQRWRLLSASKCFKILHSCPLPLLPTVSGHFLPPV